MFNLESVAVPLTPVSGHNVSDSSQAVIKSSGDFMGMI